MTDNDVKTQWLDSYRRLSINAEKSRDSQSVAFGLLKAYDSLSDHEREAIFPILEEWLLSNDNMQRYDASFLISQRCIKEMKHAVEKAITLSNSQSGPEYRYESKNLSRILSELD